MKWILRTLLVLVLALAAWASWTYPRIGELTFTYGAALEAQLYGLQKHTVDIGETQLVTYQGGPAQGETIVMIHGYTADKDVWPRFARHLLDEYRVVIPDLAGHGESAYDPAADHSIKAQAERVAAMMDRLGIARAHIIGNSMGGHITGYFAIHYPEKTLSAAPIDPAGVISPELSDMGHQLAAGRNPFLIETREDFAAFYPMSMASPPWLPGFVLDAIADQYIVRRARHEKIFADIHSTTIEADLNRLQAPALLIWGREDRLIHVSAVDVWSAGVPQLQVAVLDGIGHMPMVEAPVETAEIYHAFLQSVARN